MSGLEIQVVDNVIRVSEGMGPPGPQGPQGPIGPAGPQGPAGTNGTNGTNGADGADGATGPAGPQGPQGPQGAAGATGAAGAAGVPGAAGATGAAGAAGAPGATGATGAPGNSAPTGRWIGAGELIPRVTSGAGIDGEELATNKTNLDYLAFDTATAEYAQASFAWPAGFSTFTATFHWTAVSGSGGVTWRCSARCYADDDALDQAQGTAISVSDTLLAANDAHRSAATTAVTPAGTVAAGNLCIVEVCRNPADASDTLAVDARLIGIQLEFA